LKRPISRLGRSTSGGLLPLLCSTKQTGGRRRRLTLIIGATILLLAGGAVHSSARAQSGSGTRAATASSTSTAADSSLEDHRNEFGFWAASSFGLASALGGSRDASIPFIMGFRYGRVLFVTKALAFEYTADLVPVAIVSQPKAASPSTSGSTGRDHVYGGGVVPVGLQFIFNPHGRIRPFLAARSGPFYFSSPVPEPGATHFNFLSTGDIGVQIPLSGNRAISAGYRIGHVSNAGISRVNPGFNSSSLFAGFSIYK